MAARVLPLSRHARGRNPIFRKLFFTMVVLGLYEGINNIDFVLCKYIHYTMHEFLWRLNFLFYLRLLRNLVCTPDTGFYKDFFVALKVYNKYV